MCYNVITEKRKGVIKMKDYNANLNEVQDTNQLIKNVKNDIKDSLTEFMGMLKTDLKILRNKKEYKNVRLATSEEIIEGYIEELNDIMEYHFSD
jgi:hypothetical protein